MDMLRCLISCRIIITGRPVWSADMPVLFLLSSPKQPQRNMLWIGNVETPRTLSNSLATGEGSALSRSWPGGSNPLHDGTVPNPTGRTTPDVAGVDPDGRLTLEVMKLNSRQQLKIATWNVRTINSPGNKDLVQDKDLVQESARYNMYINAQMSKIMVVSRQDNISVQVDMKENHWSKCMTLNS